MDNMVRTYDEIELTDAQLESICGADGTAGCGVDGTVACGADGMECEIPVILLAKLKVEKIFCFHHPRFWYWF